MRNKSQSGCTGDSPKGIQTTFIYTECYLGELARATDAAPLQ